MDSLRSNAAMKNLPGRCNGSSEPLGAGNDLIRYEFSRNAELLSAYDKEVKRQILKKGEMQHPLAVCGRTEQLRCLGCGYFLLRSNCWNVRPLAVRFRK